ncbi:carbohydrate ABC transporter permease [Actinoplanes couchii]|uniref:Sugar ABC transporter, permease protein n=1 Tax=Actinoplanes couchii TaxID=403638 RepID=A0ABQ3XGI3_9ACTN|nr:carbohydrate ABC transporter permease [Actinoplanes couchii]MDR6321077.1 multiple sugar transport system permease protein [Actinoplanes couchii]GID57588.1 putative sugar ABC transporter, permease protein [Actinoplanes couchii]
MSRRIANVVTYLLLGIGAVITLAPYLLSVQTSLKTPEQFAAASPLAPPSPVSAGSYAELVVGDHTLVPPLVITVQVVILVVLGQLTCSVLAAYAFARLDFPGRDLLFWVYLGTLMVPLAATLVPRFVLVSGLGLRDTFWGIVLPTLFGSPYAVFLLRQFFRGIPTELLDAARIDGAGHPRVLRHVILPLSRPVLATLLIITVVAHWNEFLWPLVVTSSERWQVLTVAVSALQSQYHGNWTLVMAATTLATLPLLVLFVLFQRHIVKSITITGMK